KTARDGAARAHLLNEASIFVPSPDGMQRVRLEAQAAGAALAAPPGVRKQPELAAAAVARLAEDKSLRDKLGAGGRTDVEKVIGLFLEEEIPPGMSFADTVEAIRDQGGLVYVPHPFDRTHTVPDAKTLHRHLADIDVFEVFNARLLFEASNDEALRFARKYNLTMGAGSDAHVVQGVGTGALRMRAFRDAEEFLISPRTAEILRPPKSLVYLQSLKWLEQAKERVR